MHLLTTIFVHWMSTTAIISYIMHATVPVLDWALLIVIDNNLCF